MTGYFLDFATSTFKAIFFSNKKNEIFNIFPRKCDVCDVSLIFIEYHRQISRAREIFGLDKFIKIGTQV